jgi:hypothetical protein
MQTPYVYFMWFVCLHVCIACQSIKESSRHEELHEHFEAVLVTLGQIQDSYRNYHLNACFGADKYPLTLIDEFKTYVQSVSSSFSVTPQKSHRILVEYNSIFDNTIRLNKSFFEKDPSAGGVAPRLIDTPASLDEPDVTSQQTADASALAFGVYCSPNLRVQTPGDDTESEHPMGQRARADRSESPPEEGEAPDVEFYAGNFDLVVPAEISLGRFFEESSFAPVVVSDGPQLDAETGGDAVAPSAAPVMEAVSARKIVFEVHPDYTWLKRECSQTPLATSQFESLEEDDDRRDYSDYFMSMFIKLSADEILLLTSEMLSLYNDNSAVVERGEEKRALESDPKYQRTAVPVDINAVPLVPFIDITIDDVRSLVSCIQDSLIGAVEGEAKKRLDRAALLTVERKVTFTDELEDRLRTHWPRRGRVETQIKQPREAELLNHEEKTWRHIQGIQERMKALQSKFWQAVNDGKTSCDAYVGDIAALRNSLSSQGFRNLAALQGVDVKARSASLLFQSSCAHTSSTLTQMCTQDASGVAVFARDFRKVCPPQVAGTDGGYSASELAEIDVVVEGQCAEVETIAEEWKHAIQQLVEQQHQSLKSQEEFTQKYDKVSQGERGYLRWNTNLPYP